MDQFEKDSKWLKNLLQTYKGDGLSVANILFHPPEVKLLEKYVDVLKRSFRTPVQEVDFENAKGAEDIINAWCEKQTNKRMKYVVGLGKIFRHFSPRKIQNEALESYVCVCVFFL